MMRAAKYLRIAIFGFFILQSVMTLAQNMRFQHIGIAEGLPSNKAFAAREDMNGFIWIATENGVVRFDGNNLKTYSLDKIEDIRRRTFVSLFLDIDPAGGIWLISNNGLLFTYERAIDEFVLLRRVAPPNGNIYVSEFMADAGRLLIGSYNGMYAFDLQQDSLYHQPGVQSTVSSIIKSDDQYYIGARDGIFVYDKDLKPIKNLKNLEINKHWISGEQKIESLYLQSAESLLWVGTENSGIYTYHLSHEELSVPEALKGLIDVPVRSIANIGGGKLMVGTDGAGLIHYDAYNQEVLAHYSYDEDEEESLSSNAVYDVFVNSQGVMFVSTYRGGVSLYNPQRQQFSAITHLRGEPNSLKNDVVLSIAEPMPGKISFGTDKGISLWDVKRDTWQNVQMGPWKDDAKSAVVLSQTVDARGDLWAASFIYSLSHLQLVNGQFEHGAFITDLPKNLRVKKVFSHPHGDLLIGTVNSGLYVIDKNKDIKTYAIAEPLDFEVYAADKVIIGGRDGVAILDLERGEIDWLGKREFAEELKGKVVVSILVDAQRKIWIGTLDKGIYQLDVDTKTIKTFSRNQGLASDHVFDMVADVDGNVWVATGMGLSKISGDEVVNFYLSDGLISTDFNRNAAISTADGKLYFGTNNGVIAFDPRTIGQPNIQKRLVFTDFYLNHERIIAGEHSVLKKVLNECDELDLAYNQNSFSIGFTNIDFIHPGLGQYAWKLDGFDQDWVTGDGADRATYTNLNPGEYTFRIKLTDQLGNLLAPENTLALEINQPYWKTPLAYVVYLLIIIVLIALMLYSYRMRMETKHAGERLHFLIEMAHEIKTPLTLIRAPLTDLLNNKATDDESRESLQVALNSAEKLHKQMMQFLDFRRIDIRKDSLQITKIDLVDFITQKVFAFKVLADKKGLNLVFDHQTEYLYVNCDDKILDKIVSNLISNAIKYTNEGGSVTLSLFTKEKKWMLSVKDTGIGIPKEDQRKIFTLFYRTPEARQSGSTGSGVGLVLAADLARTLGGSVKLSASDSNGSEFMVTMPMDKLEITSVSPIHQEVVEMHDQETVSNDKFKILMVEDDEDLRHYQKHKFEHKYQIITASNGEEALELVKNNPPDLIISDVMMPKMNGRQLCMNIKTNVLTSHIPVILLTGLESKENIQQGLESGADDYIIKPFDFDILSSKVDNLLQTRAAFKEKFVSSDEVYEYQDLTNELDQQFLDEISRLVEENISDPDLSVNYLCQAMGMSRTSFYHKLKSLVDLSPAEFIRTIRLKKARKLLLNPSNNISEVAYSTGFSDAKYFSTLFKKYYQQSPSTFVAERREASRIE